MIYRLKNAQGQMVGTSQDPILSDGSSYRTNGMAWLDPVPGDGSYIELVRDLDAERAQIWEAIKAARDLRTQAGGYQVSGKWYHSDTFSRTQQLGLVLMGQGVPGGLMWKTMDGSFVEMTPTLATQVFAAAAAQDQAMFARAEVLRAAVYAAEDPATVDISVGWPATYGGA